MGKRSDDETTGQGDVRESTPAKGKKRRGAAAVLLVVVLGLCLGLSLATSAASLAQGWLLSRQVAALQAQITAAGEEEKAFPARTQQPDLPSLPVTGEQPLAVQTTGVVVGDERLDVALLVYRSGPADLLFETPLLEDRRGREYRPDADSLEQAHYDLLDLVTGGQAVTSLQFPRPDSTAGLRLIFNAGRTAEDPVAPRIVVLLDVG